MSKTFIFMDTIDTSSESKPLILKEDPYTK